MRAARDYVSINGSIIRRNAMRGEDNPVIRIARSRSDNKPRYAHEIAIDQPCRLVYQPDGAIMKCGARLVIEAPRGSVRIMR